MRGATAILAAVLAACHAAPGPTERAADPAVREPVLPASVPDSAVGHQLAWLLDVLAHGGAVDRDTLDEHVVPALLAKLPGELAQRAFAQLARVTAGLTIASVAADDPAHLVLHAVTAGGKLKLTLALDPASQRIAQLDVAADLGPRPTSFDDAITRLRAQAPASQLLVAELRDGACQPLHSWNADAELAVASQVELYTLIALADRIAGGQAQWDDAVAVRDDWRSLPPGVTQHERAGGKLSLRTLAERMIALDDNTAADYLLYALGRDRVEAALRDAHHAHPEHNLPLLATRELWWFKLEMARAEIDRYFALAPAERRRFLAGLAGKLPDGDRAHSGEPRELDRVEWFASANDVCRAMAALQARAHEPAGAPLLAILGQQPGLDADDVLPWTYVGFKAGSEPGVFGATWLLQRGDGRWFVVHLGLNAQHALDDAAARAIAAGVIGLVAAER